MGYSNANAAYHGGHEGHKEHRFKMCDLCPSSRTSGREPIPFISFIPEDGIMRILVTGGAGFIGSHVVEALAARGDEPAILDEFNDYYDVSIKRRNAVETGARIFEGDLRDKSFVSATLQSFQPGAVIHLAARAGVRPSLEDPQLYVATNLNGTLNLLDAMVAIGCKHLAFASSSSVYGNNPKVPFAEEDPLLNLISPYAITKLAGEHLCSVYANLHGMSISGLRFFTVFGPRQRPDLAIAKFATLINEEKPIPVYGDGSTSRDYTYVADIVSGVLASLDRLKPGFRTFNLGGDHPVSLAEMIAVIERVVGKPAIIDRLPMQPGDVERTSADLTRSRAELGYQPTTSFEDGIRKFWDWKATDR
jgi:UDP-glucuronate 4-epimerase